MALDKLTLKTSLEATFSNLDPSKTPADVAQELADAIELFVKSGTVNTNVTGTTSPTVPGTPAAVTGTGTGSVT